MGSESKTTYALTLILTEAEAKGLWSTAGQLVEDRSRIYGLLTEGIPRKELQQELKESEVDAFLKERLEGAHSGFQKLFDAISERFGPQVQLGPHRLK